MSAALRVSKVELAFYGSLSAKTRVELELWRDLIAKVEAAARDGEKVTKAIERVATAAGKPPKTLLRKYYASRKDGWRALLDGRLNPVKRLILPPAFIEHWKGIQQKYQRDTSGKAAHRALLRSWSKGEPIPGYSVRPVAEAETGIPAGWSYRHLMRFSLSKIEAKATRVGRSAASAMLPKVLTTRVGILPGQFFILDDQDYDVQVAFLGINRKITRPSGFNGIDLSSGCDVIRGYKPTILNPDGTKQKLRQVDFEWFVVGLLTTIGYREDTGTVIVREHGTAKESREFAERIAEVTGGKVTLDASGIHGAQLCGLFRGQPRGNPRYKAARESWFNLLRNEMAALPGPTGLNREHAPEENYGLDQYTRRLLDAAVGRPELAERLRLPVLTWQDFVFTVETITDAINNRTDHDLEGWITLGRVASEWRLSNEMPWLPASQLLALPDHERAVAESLIKNTPALWRQSKLSPAQVWEPARRELTRVSGALVPVLLGDAYARPARVTEDHSLSIKDVEISAEPMIFDAALTNGHILSQGQEVRVYLNPYIPQELQVCDPAGRFIGTAPLVQRICRTDTDALNRRYGHVKSIEARVLQPVAARGAAQARERIAMHEHNARVLAGEPVTPSRLPEDSDAFEAATTRPALPEHDDADSLADALRELT